MCDNCKHEIFQAVMLVSLVSHFQVLDQPVVDLFQYCVSLIWSKCKLDWILKLRFLKISAIVVRDGCSDIFCITTQLILINT